MTVIDPILPEDAKTEPFEAYRRGERKGDHILPRGTYEAKLQEVHVVRRKRDGAYLLRLIAQTIGLGGKYVIAWRGLSTGSDPFELTEGEVKSLRKYATTMGIPVPAPAQEIVRALELLAVENAQVEAKVVHTPAGIRTVISRLNFDRSQATPSTTLTVAGHTIDVNGELLSDEQLQGRAAAANEAHRTILHGLGQVRVGLLTVGKGCYELRESEGWRDLGLESLLEYLAQPEITMSKTDFYRSADIWDTYVLEGGLDPELLQGAEASKLEVPLPALKAGLVSAEQAAADAESMPRRDLREHYKELLGAPAEDPAPSPAPPSPEPESRRRDDDEAAARLQAAEDNAGFLSEELAKANRKVERLEIAEGQAQQLAGKVLELELQLEGQSQLPDDQADLVDAAKRAVRVLRRVLDEVGRPEQKRMGKELRFEVIAALEEADSFGLGEGA